MTQYLHRILVFFMLLQLGVSAQNKVLVFHQTNGFNHGSIGDGIAMIQNLGTANGLWTTDVRANASDFTTEKLKDYKVVIWCNTSGNNLLTLAQKEAFESYIGDGGGFVGIHAATDTYRDGSWPFYNELVGAIIQTDPRNHTSNDKNATMTISEKSHPTVSFIQGTTWNKTEEYYYWGNDGTYFDTNHVLLTVERTGPAPFDEPRPMSWYKEFGGGRSFYTALGHHSSDYKGDTTFIKHVEEGIKWAGNFDSTTPEPESVFLQDGNYIIKNPKRNEVLTSSMQTGNNVAMEILSEDNSQFWALRHLNDNIYTIQNIATNRYLEVPRAVCENGANVATWTNANANHQKFKVEKIESNYFLKPMHCVQLGLDRSMGAPEANVQLYAFNTTSNTNREWEILKSTNLLSTGTFNSEKQNIAIFPNPVRTIFSIAGLSEKTVVVLFDLQGKVVLQKEIDSKDSIIDMSGLPKGVYFLKSSSSLFDTKKIIKIL